MGQPAGAGAPTPPSGPAGQFMSPPGPEEAQLLATGRSLALAAEREAALSPADVRAIADGEVDEASERFDEFPARDRNEIEELEAQLLAADPDEPAAAPSLLYRLFGRGPRRAGVDTVEARWRKLRRGHVGQARAMLFNAREGRGHATSSALLKLAAAYGAELTAHRSMGGELDVHDGGEERARQLVQSALRRFPTSWIAESNAFSIPVQVRHAGAGERAAYRRRDDAPSGAAGRDVAAILVPAIMDNRNPYDSGGPDRAALHELGHRMQHANPAISALEHEHIRRRTTAPTGEREPLTPLPGKGESGWASNFADPYQGRDYSGTYPDDTPTEILSVGMEALFGGAYGGFIGAGRYASDDDSRFFILGLLATHDGGAETR